MVNRAAAATLSLHCVEMFVTAFRWIAFASGVACAAWSGQATAAGCRAADAELLAAVRAVDEKQKNVGVQAAIWRDGALVWSQALGYADRERGRRMTADTPIAVASLTKGFTGVALLLAEERGRIDLDAPIQRYLPEFPVRPEGVITPRALVAHYSGLPHWSALDRAPLQQRRFDRLDQLLPLYKDLPLKPAAVKEYSYSSIGYNVLALAMERATGVEFQDYVRREIIAPLKLTRTGFENRLRPHRDIAVRYSWTDVRSYYRLPAAERAPEFDYSHNMAGGNMYSTAEDMARFGGALTAPGFLHRDALDRLYTRFSVEGVKPGPATYGWFASAPESERILNLTGANPGVQAGTFIYPERRVAVSVLSNSWGIDSSSGEMVSDLPKRLADLCAPGPRPASA